MAATVVILPEPAQSMLSANIPDLEITCAKVYQADVLPDCRDGVQSRVVIWIVRALDLLEESSFAGIVEPEEQDGVL